MNKKDICSYNYDELKEEMLAIGEKAFRSKQIYEWDVYKRQIHVCDESDRRLVFQAFSSRKDVYKRQYYNNTDIG